MRAAVILALAVAVLNFAWMPGQFLDGDPAAWREEARSIVLRGELAVPAEFASRFFEPGQYFVRNDSSGRYYSKYGLMNALMSLPPLWAQAAAGVEPSTPGTGACRVRRATKRRSNCSFLLFRRGLRMARCSKSRARSESPRCPSS